MKKQKVVIYGTGSFAQYFGYVISHDKRYELSGFCVEKNYIQDFVPHFPSIPLIESEKINMIFPPDKYRLFAAIGNNGVREEKYKSFKKEGYSFISYVSGKSIVFEDLKYKENVFISEDSGIQPFVSIGCNTIIIGSKIGHHSSIGDNVLLSCCFLGGNVNVGNNTFVGLNATIKEKTVIAEDNLIGMGCTITCDTNYGDVFTCGKTTVKRMVAIDRLKNII
jgi:sugar O-acyltransferase (sialic acid O-acetyltransferase NeuD family)